LWLLLTVGFALAHLVWLCTGAPRTLPVKLYDISAISLLAFVATLAFFRASKRVDLPASLNGALRFLGFGFLCIGLGGVALCADSYFHWADTSPFSAADSFFLCTFPCFVAALLRLPSSERRAFRPLRILIDGVVFVVGIGVPLWLFAVQPGLQNSTGIDAVLVVVWPLFSFLGVMAVNAALLTKAPFPSRSALVLLLAGLGLNWLADLIFTLDAVSQILRSSPVVILNVVNTLAIATSIVAAWRYSTDALPDSKQPSRSLSFSPVPLITILGMGGWLLSAVFTQSSFVTPERILISMVGLFVILFVRELWVTRETHLDVADEVEREGWARFEALVRHSSDVILIGDALGTIRFASPAAQTALGIASEALSGRPLRELVHPENEAAVDGFLKQLESGASQAAPHLWRLKHQNGGYRHFEVAGTNLLSEAKIGGLVFNLRDVTERVELEKRLRHAQKMEAVGRMAGGVAHDFNNLLTSIMGHCELALSELPENSALRKDLQEVLRAGKRGAGLTRRLLLLNRPTHEAPELVCAARLVREMLPVLQQLAGAQHPLQLNIDPAADGLVRTSRDFLEEMLLQLTGNARDASTEGSSLVISLKAVDLWEPLPSPYLAANPGRYIVVEVSDTGVGMDEATRARLFEPFFTTKPLGRGRGLGLSSIFGTVKAIGGGLTVKTEPGRGTSIGVWLPEVLDSHRKAAAPSPEKQATAKGAHETLLLLEDEPAVRSATERYLRQLGYRVLSAGDADEAEARLAEFPGEVDLLLSDVMMPGRSGPAFASQLLRERPRLRILFMSGYTGRELEAHGLAHAGDHLLVKPFSLEELSSRLRRVAAGPAGLHWK
jgi:PAS domain S-box-containing protein